MHTYEISVSVHVEAETIAEAIDKGEKVVDIQNSDAVVSFGVEQLEDEDADAKMGD